MLFLLVYPPAPSYHVRGAVFGIRSFWIPQNHHSPDIHIPWQWESRLSGRIALPKSFLLSPALLSQSLERRFLAPVSHIHLPCRPKPQYMPPDNKHNISCLLSAPPLLSPRKSASRPGLSYPLRNSCRNLPRIWHPERPAVPSSSGVSPAHRYSHPTHKPAAGPHMVR